MRYRAVTWTVVVWAVVSFAALAFERFIPVVENEDYLNHPGEYWQQAKSQEIHWRTFNAETLQEARRLDRPIFLLIGHGGNRFARRFDQTLELPRVAERLNRDFVCARIDELNDPKWRSAMLQISRVGQGQMTGFGAFVMSGEGYPLAFFDSAQGNLIQDRLLLAFLREAGLLYASQDTQLKLRMDEENFLLQGGQESVPPSVNAYYGHQQQYLNEPDSGKQFTTASPSRLWPQEWILAEEVGANGLGVSSSRADAGKGPDWIYGGYFLRSLGMGWQEVDPLKMITASAQMLEYKSLAYRRSPQPSDKVIIDRTFHHLVELLSGPIKPTYQTVELGDYNRSSAHSMSYHEFQKSLSAKEQNEAIAWLGMDVRRNPQMIPYLTSKDWDQAEFVTLLDQMRKAHTPEFIEGGFGLTYSRGAAIAALLKCAHYTQDFNQKVDAMTRFATFRNDVRVGPNDVYGNYIQPLRMGNLPDYLAYADAAWSAYMLSGDQEYWDEAYAVVERAMVLFAEDTGVPVIAPQEDLGEAGSRFAVAEIADGYARSCSGLCMQLLSVLAASSRDASARSKLRNQAAALVTDLSAVVEIMPFGAGGFMRGIVQFQSDAVLIAGPDVIGDVSWANPLPVIAGLEPGFMVRYQGSLLGPFSASEARVWTAEHVSSREVRLGE